jgi:AcrR family transcriptional regulator
MDNQSKRQRILQAAIELFAENGFEITSIQDIAKRASVAKGTVYVYFESKEVLVKEVHKLCYEMDVRACREGMESLDSTVDQLCKRLDNIMSYAITHPLESRIEQLYGMSPVYGKEPFEVKPEMMDDIKKIIQEGIAQGELRPLSVDLLATMYYGIAQCCYLKLQEAPDFWDRQETKDFCYDLIRNSFTK